MHSERHVLLYGTNPLSRLKLDNGKLAGRGPGAPGTCTCPLTHPVHPCPVFSCPGSAQPVPPASWVSPHRPGPPTGPHPVHPPPALFRALCSQAGRGRGASAHTHWASPHRAPGTADVCDAAVWWGRGKCARGVLSGHCHGFSELPPFCSPRPGPCLLVLVVLPDPLGQGLSPNAPLPARSSLWAGVSSTHQCLLSGGPFGLHLEGVW